MLRQKRNRKSGRELAKDGCRGWVYVVDNEGVINRVKIGFTLTDPAVRVRGLQETGYAFPQVVQYHALVDNPHRLEKRVHAELATRRRNGEWFEVSLIRAIDVIRSSAATILFEDETPRWHPSAHPPTAYALTRLQREREAAKRAKHSPQEHSHCTRGEDIFQQVSISAEMALRGCKVEAQAPNGDLLSLRCPAGISDMQHLRAKGQGYFSLNGGPRGDLIVRVRVR
jgi:hypothetical protein